MSISNGDFLDENGRAVNLMALLRDGSVVESTADHHMAPHSGWFTDEDGEPVNLITVIQNSSGGGGGGSGISIEAVNALLSCFEHVAWTDGDGDTYIEALRSALTVRIVSISAAYTQTQTVYNTSELDSLKSDLIVTATYANQSTSVLPANRYILSGLLEVGESEITVTVGELTDTIIVEVTEDETVTPLYDWDFTKSMTDTIDSVVATTNFATQNQNGLTISEQGTYVEFPGVYAKNRTYEIDVVSIDRQVTNSYGRLWMVDKDTLTSNGGSGFIITGSQKHGDLFYINGAWESGKIVSDTNDPDGSYYNSSTVGFYVDNDGYVSVYKDGVYIGRSSTMMPNAADSNVYLGSLGTSYSPDNLYDAIFSGFRVYDGLIY